MKQERDVSLLVEEAVRDDVTAAAITDLESDQVAETQMALIVELEHRGLRRFELDG